MSAEKGYKDWSDEKLIRKANQAWDMAGLSRQERNTPDEIRRTNEARAYDQELARRHG